MIKTILLDYDGVIVDSIDSIISVWQESCNKFGNKTITTKDLVRNSATGAWRLFYASKLGITPEYFEQATELFKERTKSKPAPEIFPGMDEVIKLLSKTHNLYILSSNDSALINSNLERLNLLPYFKGVAGDHEAGSLNKTDPQFILGPLKNWGEDFQSSVYVGDTADEAIGSKVAGIKSIGCSWGYQSRYLIEQSNPDGIADSPEDLIKLIRDL